MTVTSPTPSLVGSSEAVLALLVFAVAYVFVITEEFTNVRKSKPVIVAAGAIWILVAIAARSHPDIEVGKLLDRNLLDYAGVLLFLFAAMTYVNVLEERQVFAALRSWMIARKFPLRRIYWLTGMLAFLLSPCLDNLTTALVMGAVVLGVGSGNPRFLVPACINIVVAANAGGAFSPFGDITTLMVWQQGVVSFSGFFHLFLPALVNWLVPALCMQFAVPAGAPLPEAARAGLKAGGFAVILLFAGTIAATVLLHQFLHLPPYLGMMTGLGMLMFHGHFIRRCELRAASATLQQASAPAPNLAAVPFDIFQSMRRVEWDTLLFFYGVVLCVGGLEAMGYLTLLSRHSYTALGPSVTNTVVGLASAVIDNVPIMFAVLSMNPEMSQGHWLLVTLTAGVGGSLLSIGSAAGVALMGQARGIYTFMAHLRWFWAIALGYAASIGLHFLLNGGLF